MRGKKLFLFGSGLLLFGAAIVLPFADWLKVILYLAVYMVFGKDVIVNAIKSMTKGQVFNENFLMTIAFSVSRCSILGSSVITLPPVMYCHVVILGTTPSRQNVAAAKLVLAAWAV